MTPPARLKAAFEIKDHLLDLVQSMLRDSKQQGAVNATVEAAYALYVSKYNRR